MQCDDVRRSKYSFILVRDVQFSNTVVLCNNARFLMKCYILKSLSVITFNTRPLSRLLYCTCKPMVNVNKYYNN